MCVVLSLGTVMIAHWAVLVWKCVLFTHLECVCIQFINGHCNIWPTLGMFCVCVSVGMVRVRTEKERVCVLECVPSLGMVRMGICVIDPFLPSTLPARS